MQALNALFYSVYYNKGTSIFVFTPINLAWTQQHGGLNVTITINVVYALAERAELRVMN